MLLDWDYIGIMEEKMETTIMGYIGCIYIYGDYRGIILVLYRDNGKENGNYQSILGVYTVLGVRLARFLC